MLMELPDRHTLHGLDVPDHRLGLPVVAMHAPPIEMGVVLGRRILGVVKRYMRS